MKKIIPLILILAITLIIIFSIIIIFKGSNDNNIHIKYLDDGTIVTGDVQRLNITGFNLIPERKLLWDNKWENYSYNVTRTAIVPYDLDIADIFTNYTKRKDIALNYLDKNIPLASHPLDWNENYTGYNHPIGGNILIQNFSLGNSLYSWKVVCSVKNEHSNSIDLTFIFIHFYSNRSVLLSTRNAIIGDLQPGETENFSVRYDGSLKNDVSYISFEIITDPFEKMGPINQLIP